MKRELQEGNGNKKDKALQIKKAKPVVQSQKCMKIGINIKGTYLVPSSKQSLPQGLPDGGKFGWAILSDVKNPIPYIFVNGVKYVSKRIVANTVLSTYPHFPEEVFQCLKIESEPLTESESHLLNEINFRHCDSQFGAYAFSSASDMKTPLEDFEKAHNFYLFAKRILYEKELRQECCGFLMIDKNSYVPFVRRGSLKLLPTFYFEGETNLQPITCLELSRWEMTYLRLLCQVQQIKKQFFSGPTCKVMDLEDITKLFSTNATFEEAWPTLLIKQWATDQLSKSKNNKEQNNQVKENLEFSTSALQALNPGETIHRKPEHVPTTTDTNVQSHLKELINISNASNSRIEITMPTKINNKNMPELNKKERCRKQTTLKHLILPKPKSANFEITTYSPKSSIVSNTCPTKDLNVHIDTKNNHLDNKSLKATNASIGITDNAQNKIIKLKKLSTNQTPNTLKTTVANANKSNINKDQRNTTNPTIVNNIKTGIDQANQKILNKDIPSNVLHVLNIDNKGNEKNLITKKNKHQPDDVPPSGWVPTLIALKMSKERNIIKISENSLPEFLAKNPHLEVSKIALTPEQAKTFEEYYNINSNTNQVVLQSPKPTQLTNKSQLNEAKDPDLERCSKKTGETEEILRQPIPTLDLFSPPYTVVSVSISGKNFQAINLRPHRLNTGNKVLISTRDIGAEFFPTKFRGDVDNAMKLAGLSLYKLCKSQETAFETKGKIVARNEMFVLADEYIFHSDKVQSLLCKNKS